MSPTLSPPVFALLSRLVEERAGLSYAGDNHDLIVDKIAQRAADRGFESPLDYYYFIRYDAEGDRELDQLIESLVVHETYFFREADQLQVLCDAILAPAIAAGERPRVWCAACATGEEPLTLAMMLADRAVLDRVELVASDISRRVLDRARRGDFSLRSLRALPDGVLGRWLDARDGRAVLRARLDDAIRWERINLIDPLAIASLGVFDAIVCRNVLIYFSDDTARRVVESLGAALRTGGHLLVGVSESLLRFGTSLSCEERAGAFFYRKVS